MKTTLHKTFLGESCRLYQFGGQIELALSRKIISLYYRLKPEIPPQWQVIDIVPAYTSLAIYLAADSLLNQDISPLDTLITKLWREADASAITTATTHIIPTNYNGEDLESLVDYHHLSIRQLIDYHCQPDYFIAMLGFKPYFPYLIGLNEQLVTPRRDNPRLNVAAGSVAIGGRQTGIYTANSPGGWHIIGHTEFRDFQLFRPGDLIRFQESKLC